MLGELQKRKPTEKNGSPERARSGLFYTLNLLFLGFFSRFSIQLLLVIAVRANPFFDSPFSENAGNVP